MTERPVLILGGGSDIGLAIARRFARDGRPVQLALRRPEAAEDDRNDIALRHGVEVTTHRFDVLDIDAIEGFYDSLPALPGVVVSVIGLLGDQERTEADPALARLVVETNFLGPTLALEAAARRLAALDEDTGVIGVSSVAGDRGRARNYWYGAAKAGFTTALSGLRQKYGQGRLRVLTVKPGFVATRMTEGMDLPPALTATPDQIAELVHKAWRKGRASVTPPRWRLVMGIVRMLPDPIFRRVRF